MSTDHQVTQTDADSSNGHSVSLTRLVPLGAKDISRPSPVFFVGRTQAMLTRMKHRISDERGFTLIELLVVILIIGILAAIAIPSFLNQRQKAQDACAKSIVRTSQTAMETYFTDYGNYSSVTLTSLNALESAIPTGGTCGGTNVLVVGDDASGGTGACSGSPAAPSYCVGVLSVANDRPFVLHRSPNGLITRVCGTSAGGTGAAANGGGCPSGTW
jgi:type IV pilus assembly protein PilA